VLGVLPRGDQSPAALVRDEREFALVVGDLRSGLTRRVRLNVDGARLHKAALGPDGSYWVAGRKNRYRRVGFKGIPFAMIYVARFDANGRKLLEKVYDHEKRRDVEGIVALPTGDLLVAAHEDRGAPDPDTAWVGKIAPAGRILWDRRIELEGPPLGDRQWVAVGTCPIVSTFKLPSPIKRRT
jgi:hypothetical protein